MVPYGFMLVLIIFNVLTIPIILLSTIKLPLVLMGIYYWSIYRPRLFPVWLIFIAGVFLDFIMGLPFGLNALTLVLAQWFVTDQRRFLMGQSFIVIWLGFVILSAIVSTLQWIIFGLVNGAWVSLEPQMWSLLIGSAVFPFIYWLLHLTHKMLPFPTVTSPYTIKHQSRYKGVKG